MRAVRWSAAVAASVFQAIAALPAAPTLARAQDTAVDAPILLARGPRFLLATKGAQPRPIDVDRTPILRERIALELANASLDNALATIARKAGIRLIYSGVALDLGKRVSFRTDRVSVAAALTEVLLDTDVDILFTVSGREAVLVKRGSAQVGVITGRVTDSATGLSIALVEIRIAGTQIEAATDDSGRYVLRDVPVGEHSVTARRIGYEAQTRSAAVADGGTVTLDFALKAVATRLDELVTTVTGREERYKIGNAITSIRGDSVMLRAPITNFQDLLAGRAPGLQILNTSGVSGTSNAIRIRGVNSFVAGNDPLIVVDGARVENSSQSSVFDAAALTNVIRTGRMADLNPNEIESIEVIKGPSAATLYGTDAANGVIVVTTKRGRAGPSRWTLTAEQSLVTNNTTFPDAFYAFGRSTATGDPVRCTTVNQAANLCTLDSLSRFTPLNDPALTPIGTGYRSAVNLQVSGGSQALQYFLAGGYEDETGYLRMPEVDQQLIREARGVAEVPDEQVRPNALTKVTLRGKFTMSPGDKADATFSAGYVSNDTRLPPSYDPAVRYGILGPGYRNTDDGWLASWARPSQTFAARNRDAADRFTMSINGNWRPVGWLATRATAGLDYSSEFLDFLARAGESDFVSLDGSRVNSRTNILLSSADLGATATFDVTGYLRSRTSAGAQYNRREAGVTTIDGFGLPVGSETVAGATSTQVSESTVESVVAGAYLEQGFGWRDRVYLTGALRFDGGSAFGSSFETAVYPKASLSWVALGADGERHGPLSLLRLRTAYGQSGVQPSPEAALARAQLLRTLEGSGAVIASLGNPLLEPERQTEFEAGVDAELWGGRVAVEATAYHRRSRNALVDVPLPPSVALTSVQQNLGSVRNRGIEGLITVRAVESRVLTVDIGLNGSINQNRLLDLGPGVQPVGVGQEGTRQTPGYPLYGQWARPILSYSDANGDGILEPSEVQVGDTAVFVGSAKPTRQLTGTLTLGLFDGRVRVAGLADYRGGYGLRNLSENERCEAFTQMCRALNDPSAPLEEQAAMIGYRFHARALGGYYSDASFLRFRELSLSYDLSPSLLRALRVRSMTVTLAGRNLGLITGYPGIDPEALQPADNPDVAPPYGTPPPATHWIARVTVSP